MRETIEDRAKRRGSGGQDKFEKNVEVEMCRPGPEEWPGFLRKKLRVWSTGNIRRAFGKRSRGGVASAKSHRVRAIIDQKQRNGIEVARAGERGLVQLASPIISRAKRRDEKNKECSVV